MFSVAPQFGMSGVIGLFVAVALFMLAMLFLAVVAFVAFAIFKRSGAAKAVGELVTVNPFDGIDQQEREVLENLLKEHKRAKIEAEIKETMKSALGDQEKAAAATKR